jgi:uncharacterized protein YpmB
MRLRIVAIVLVCALIFTAFCSSASEFTQEDRDRLIRVETTLQIFMQQVDKRFDQMMTFLWILAGIFTALVAAVIGFAYWDRRTIIRRAKEEAMEDMKREGLLRSILKVLRDIAPDNVKLAEVLRKYNLL